MATVIHFDGREEEVQPKNGKNFTLDELKFIVEEGAPPGSDMIEIIGLRDGRIMVLNEEGKLIGLPRNDRATQVAGLPTPAERSAYLNSMRKKGYFVINTMGPLDEDYIAGTVLVCKNSEVE